MSNIVKAINRATGEIIEIDANNIKEVMEAYKISKEYEKVSKSLTDQLKKILPKYLDEHGRSEEIDGYKFTSTLTQRHTYDKAVLRKVLDEDTYDLFMKPDKSAIDTYIKENLEELGETSGILRKSMIPEGKAYTTTKLNKL